MKKKIKGALKSILVLVIVLTVIGGTQVFATSLTAKYYLPANTTVSVTSTKTYATDKVGYKLDSVYPSGTYTTDNYTKIKISAYSGSTKLMSERVVYEGKATTTYDYSSVKNLSAGSNVTFKLKGNNPKLAAYAVVYLNWY